MANQPPGMSYETAVYGLRRTLTNITKFHKSVLPANWTTLSGAAVSVKDSKYQKLEMDLNYWNQMVVIACSTKDDGQNLLQNIETVIDECEQMMEDAQLQIISARNFCVEMDTKSKAKTDAESANKSQSASESDFKLEKIKPPTFSGNYSEWQSYSDLFKAAVIDNPKLSGGLKLVYLKNSLIGDAAQIAQSFPPTNLSFSEAWELVEKRYNKKREIVFSHLQKLFALQPVSDTSIGIRKMVDTINQCTRSLKLLQVEVDKWDVFVVYWAHLKLDPETRKQWLLESDDDLPELTSFLEFLEKRATALSIPTTSKSKSSDKSSHHAGTQGKNKQSCVKCGESHKIFFCPKFLDLSPQARSKFIKDKKQCFNCLGGHLTKDCKSEKRCQKCGRLHHTFLHFDTRPSTSTNQQNSEAQPSDSASNDNSNSATPLTSATNSSVDNVGSHHSISSYSEDNVILMATLLVQVNDSKGQQHKCRVFVDPGSEANFVSESLVDRLSLPRQRSCVKVTGIGGSTQNTARGLVSFHAISNFNTFSLPVKALILPRLTGQLPRNLCKGTFPHLDGLPLADPQFFSPASVDILLGAEAVSQILRPGLKRGPRGTPVAQNSKFGWFITGSSPITANYTSSFSVQVCHSCCTHDEECLESSLQRLWELEDPQPQSTQFSSDEESCEKHFLSTFSRDPEGRYEVNLPFKSNSGELGESFAKSVSCFKSLEKQLDKDPQLKEAYHSQIEDYLSKLWIEKVPESECFSSKKVKVTTTEGHERSLAPYYIPHHVVVKPDSATTKFRIVFNASSITTSGHSLNSLLHSGPKIQTDLHPLLTRFRSHPIALAADIVKFYHQVKVTPPHCDFQRFVWRKDPRAPVTHLRFLRVIFGVTASPYLAIRVLRQLGEETKELYPLAHSVIQNDFLVDNLLSGATTLEEALEVKGQITQVLSVGKFPLQKWASNHPQVLDSIPESEKESFSLDIKEDESIKTIGLYWHPASDTFGVKVTIPPNVTQVTKRVILSHVARIFDPLQWLAPVTITAKILLQDLWKEKYGWDDPIATKYLKRWQKYSGELEIVRDFRISRCLTVKTFTNSTKVQHELIGFCDASNVAYGACVYLRTKSEGETKVELIEAKSKVAPVGGETTPRLELCSVVLLCNLANSVFKALTPTKIKIVKVICFTDSTGALGQLFSNEKQTVFVSNRVRKVKNSLITISWHHVPGELNPADALTRGISASSFLKNQLRLHGPPFLYTDKFPPQPYEKSVASFNTSVDPGSSVVHERVMRLISFISSYTKMKRLLAYWIRLQNNYRSPFVKTYGPITTKELEEAKLSLVRSIQSESYAKEIEKRFSQLQVKGDIKFLSPFLDAQGILRVGGRIQKSELGFSQCHPILLPKCHTKPTTPTEKTLSHFVFCVARDFHVNNLHAAPQLLLSLIRTEFWIPRGPDLCNRVYHKCIPCFKQNPKVLTQVMGQLPASRVLPDFPFIQVGLDYAGPFQIAMTPGRNPRLIKAWVCVFICMATKAIHLEYSGGLSTPHFISAFQRFCAIRNSPFEITCDGGTNFLGEKNEAEALHDLLSSPQHRDKVSLFFTGEKVTYHFNPPLGPHHGGIWEAAVKSMKLHLSRVTQGHNLSLEEFITLLARTSAALNSRPLTPLSQNPDDFEALTPFHFLTLRAPKFIAEVDVTSFKSHRDRWQLVQQMAQHLFRRWSSDYLQSLQQKYKWLDPQPNISKGMMVLLQDVDVSFKHHSWILGRIEEVYPGTDGRVRTCDVRVPVHDPDDKKKTKTKVFRRPITRISPLPLEDNLISAFATIQDSF